MILEKQISTVFNITRLCLNQIWWNSWVKRIFLHTPTVIKLHVNFYHDVDLTAIHPSSNNYRTPAVISYDMASFLEWDLIQWFSYSSLVTSSYSIYLASAGKIGKEYWLSYSRICEFYLTAVLNFHYKT